MPPSDVTQLRDEIRRAQAETRGIREELRAGLDRLAATWAEDAKARHDLSKALEELAKTAAENNASVAELKKKQAEDDHEKTRAKTAVAIFRVAGGALLSLLVACGGYLLRSYIEVRDATRDHTAEIAAIHAEEERAERERHETADQARATNDEVIQVRTRLTSIDAALGRIEDALEDGGRRRR